MEQISVALPIKGDSRALEAFKSVLDTDGLDAALAFLNKRTDFRYTAIYRLDGTMMRNIHIYDRQGESVDHLVEVPLGDSFCQFVMADGAFKTADSATDGRLSGHAYQGVVNAYFGLPLSTAPGTMYGTLCHFDFDSKQISDSEVPFLEAVRPLLTAKLA
jgi:hypothetical protein